MSINEECSKCFVLISPKSVSVIRSMDSAPAWRHGTAAGFWLRAAAAAARS